MNKEKIFFKKILVKIIKIHNHVYKKPSYCNNCYIGLDTEKDLNIRSVKALIEDGIIQESEEFVLV